jgi:hypothetical protein
MIVLTCCGRRRADKDGLGSNAPHLLKQEERLNQIRALHQVSPVNYREGNRSLQLLLACDDDTHDPAHRTTRA